MSANWLKHTMNCTSLGKRHKENAKTKKKEQKKKKKKKQGKREKKRKGCRECWEPLRLAQRVAPASALADTYTTHNLSMSLFIIIMSLLPNPLCPQYHTIAICQSVVIGEREREREREGQIIISLLCICTKAFEYKSMHALGPQTFVAWSINRAINL